MTWLDDDMQLERDEKTAAARLRRVNEAIAQRNAALAEASRLNRDSWPAHSADERQEIETDAEHAFSQFYEEERAEITDQISKLDQAITDIGAPLVGLDSETMTRVAGLRQAIRLELQRSTPEEIERASGAAQRAGDRILARMWSEEINEHVQQTALSAPVVARLVQLARELRDESEDPADAKKRRALERRRAALSKHLDTFNAESRETRIAINRRILQASGAYSPL